jgi:hypothetical protein
MTLCGGEQGQQELHTVAGKKKKWPEEGARVL